MKKALKNIIIFILIITLVNSCVKMKDVNILNQGNFIDTTAALKDATDIKMGVAIDYTPMLSDATYASIVKTNFDAVTFGYNMKHGAIVKDDGTMNFTNADALANATGALEIFGHTLGWHSNQNATYLKSFAGITIPASTELLTNPGFELGQTGWATYNTNGATITYVTGNSANAHSGSGYMYVVNPTANPSNQWKVQVACDLFNTTSGTQYIITYYVKAASAGGSIRLSTQTSGGGSSQYQGDQTIGTTWQQISWVITANSPQTRVLFDMGQAANTYYIDDVSAKEYIQPPTGAQVSVKVDQALNTWITTMVNHYKNKVHEWDVVNEPMSPSGAYRNSANSTDISNKSASDIFFWYDYLGRDYPVKAFQYAATADPTATLFINEYGLEASKTKTDSLIAFVNELKAKGVKIDGIGTQMHVIWNSSYALIDSMFIKLATTGLKVRISEMDVRINPLAKAGFILTPLEASYQAAMYKYIVQSYIKYVPAAQRSGITIWGVTDNTSWLYNSGKDFPLLFNPNYSKKSSYAAILQALKGQ